MKNNIETLSPDSTYHIFNRANGNEKLFLLGGNYDYFLEKYKTNISPIADTFCYCLMPNHFHFLLRIKNEKELRTLTGFKTLSVLPQLEKNTAISKHLSNQFSNLFNGYTQAFNKQNNRKGNLFMRPYKRIAVTKESYLLKLVQYIHFNPIEAGLCNKLTEWKYSSYNILTSRGETFLKRQEVIEWFADLENFKHVHLDFPKEKIIEINKL